MNHERLKRDHKNAKSQIIIIKTHSQLVRGALVSYSAYVIPLSLINVLTTFYAGTDLWEEFSGQTGQKVLKSKS